MTVAHGKSAQLLLDGFNLHQFGKSFSLIGSIDLHDATVFGNDSRVKVPGLRHATASAEVFYDDTDTTGSYDVLKSKYGAGTPGILSFAPQGFTLGNRVEMAYMHEVSFNPRNVIDDLIMVSASFEAEEDSVDMVGVSLHALTAETSLPVTGTAVDNAASTANGGVGTLHVIAIAGASPNVVFKIQHSTDNSSWVDLITFTAVTAVGAERSEVAASTTIRRYLRMTATESGTTSSVTAVLNFARR